MAAHRAGRSLVGQREGRREGGSRQAGNGLYLRELRSLRPDPRSAVPSFGNDPFRGARGEGVKSRRYHHCGTGTARQASPEESRWRAIASLEPTIPSLPSPPPSVPGVPHGFSSPRIASGGSSARQNGAGGVLSVSRAAPAPFCQAALTSPLPCFLATRNPRGPWDPARTAPGAMGSRARFAPRRGRSKELPAGAVNASLYWFRFAEIYARTHQVRWKSVKKSMACNDKRGGSIKKMSEGNGP